MSKDIKKDRIVGTGELPLNVDYEAIKKGLESDKTKSQFSNFFNSIKVPSHPNHINQEKTNHQE